MVQNAGSYPAGWFPDPTARFEYRFFDGQRWTDRVARGGQEFTDPLAPVAAPVARPVASAPHAPAASPGWATPVPTAAAPATTYSSGLPRKQMLMLVIGAGVAFVGIMVFMFLNGKQSTPSNDQPAGTGSAVLSRGLQQCGPLGYTGQFGNPSPFAFHGTVTVSVEGGSPAVPPQTAALDIEVGGRMTVMVGWPTQIAGSFTCREVVRDQRGNPVMIP